MPKISNKSAQMPSSPIRRLAPVARATEARGVHVYHLNIGQPDIATPQEALEAVRRAEPHVVAYSDSAGNMALREGLVEYYDRLGIKLSVDNVAITTGGSEALIFAFSCCMDPGDEVIIPEPFYANYNGFAAQCGVKVVPIHSSIDHDFALPPIEEFERLITPRTRALVICNPNNPTGYLYSRQEVELLGQIAKKHDLFLLADEVYREFCYDGAEHFSIMKLEGLEENAVLLDSTSKRYSLCGARVGALITRNKELMGAAMRFAQARLCPPFYGQIAATGALKAPASYFKAVYDEYVTRRNVLVNGLNTIPGVYSPMPLGAFYTTARFPVKGCDKFAEWLLKDYSYQGATVMLAPASGFYATPGLGKDEARLAYVLKQEDLKQALVVLEHALAEYPDKK